MILAGVANAGAMRTFSTENISSGATKLNRALEKEIKYENENYSQLEDIETFLNESGFAFSEEDQGIALKLTKQVGDKVIEVRFEARQPLPEDDYNEEREGAGADQPEEEERGMSENYCDFTIYIADASGKKGMIVEATSMDTEINYNTVQMSNDLDKHKGLHRFER